MSCSSHVLHKFMNVRSTYELTSTDVTRLIKMEICVFSYDCLLRQRSQFVQVS